MFKSSFLAATAAVAAFAFSVVDATEPDAAGAVDLEQVVVSAALFERAHIETGSAVTVIERQEIEQRQAVFVLDLLRDVPGLAVARTGGIGSQTQVRARGAEANQILVLIDGVEVNDPALGDEFSFAHLLTTDVERIEIVRGPQSAVWGSEAVAGVINIISRQDSDQPWRLHGEAGSFDTWRAGASTGFTGDRGHLRLAVETLDSDGSNASRTGSEDEAYDNTTFSVNGELHSGSEWRLQGGARYSDSENDFDPVDFSTGLPADGDRVSRSELLSTYTRLNWQPEARPWTGELGLRYTESDNRNFSDGLPDNATAAEKWAVSLRGRYRLPGVAGIDHHLSAGLEYETTDYRQRGMASPFGDPNQNQDMDNQALVAEYAASRGQWSTALSVRFDDNSDFDNEVSHRLSLSRHLNDDQGRLWAAWASGQKAPTFTERFGFFPDQFIGNPDLSPESSDAFELGFEQLLGDAGHRLSLVYFDETLEDEINGFFFDSDQGAFTAVNVQGDSHRDGIESSLKLMLGSHWQLNMGYTYLDADEPAAGSSADDRRQELRRPEHNGHVNLQFQSRDGRWNWFTGLNYTGDQLDRFFPPFPEPSQTVTLDAYWLLSSTLRYRLNEHFSAHVRGNNLLNESYENVFGFNTPGRAAFVGLEWRP